jgi:hypothetical protein
MPQRFQSFLFARYQQAGQCSRGMNSCFESKRSGVRISLHPNLASFLFVFVVVKMILFAYKTLATCRDRTNDLSLTKRMLYLKAKVAVCSKSCMNLHINIKTPQYFKQHKTCTTYYSLDRHRDRFLLRVQYHYPDGNFGLKSSDLVCVKKCHTPTSTYSHIKNWSCGNM